jgi:hypothetical protein
MKQMQDMKEAMNMQGQYKESFGGVDLIKPQEFVKSMDWSNKDDIIKRMNADEMKNKDKELTDILNQSFDMLKNGSTPQEVQQAALDSLHQMEQGQGIGSASNSNNIQANQEGANVNV